MKISDDQNLTFRSVNNRLLRLAKSRTGRGAWGGGGLNRWIEGKIEVEMNRWIGGEDL